MFNLDGLSFDPSAARRPELPPNWPTGAQEDLRRLALGYLRRFYDASGPDRPGLCVLVTGEYGTGKTHNLGIVLAELASTNRLPGRPAPLIFYGKATSSSIVKMYKRLVKDLDVLHFASWRATLCALVARMTPAPAWPLGRAGGEEANDDLRSLGIVRPDLGGVDDPFEALNDIRLDRGAVLSAKAGLCRTRLGAATTSPRCSVTSSPPSRDWRPH